jgi:hypothetical protein
MKNAICSSCFADWKLKRLARSQGDRIACRACGRSGRMGFTFSKLGKLMEPIMRQHFRIGDGVKRFGEDDKEWWEQEGDSLSIVVQCVMGQYFDFEDEIIAAIANANERTDDYWETGQSYVPAPVQGSDYHQLWETVVEELKHERRFFNDAAQGLYARLFDGVDEMITWDDKAESVVFLLPAGTNIYRGRTCHSQSMLNAMFQDPFAQIGPPPVDVSRLGRMNAAGVVVLYAAMDERTGLAEMRPALGADTAAIKMSTTKPLRILDFARLENSRNAKGISYFQTDFDEQVQRWKFLTAIHSMISQPVVPGREEEYLITQAMAEYLAHVHHPTFDGIMFKSVQLDGGMNIVIFKIHQYNALMGQGPFPVEYVDGSIKLFTTRKVEYAHEERTVRENKGVPRVLPSPGREADND